VAGKERPALDFVPKARIENIMKIRRIFRTLGKQSFPVNLELLRVPVSQKLKKVSEDAGNSKNFSACQKSSIFVHKSSFRKLKYFLLTNYLNYTLN